MAGAFALRVQGTMAETPTTDSTWRVYARHWVWHVTTATRPEAEAQAEQFKGRLAPEDVTIEPWGWRGGDLGRWIVKVRLWSPRGEFVHRDDADTLAAALREPTEVVARNSAEEHRLLDLGTVLLPEASR